MAECPFCEIVRSDPHDQVEWATRDAVVITPLDPVTEGHKLVIPHRHVADAAENPYVSSRAMLAAAFYMEEMGVGECNLIVSKGPLATQTIFHLHLHIVPRRPGDGLALPWT